MKNLSFISQSFSNVKLKTENIDKILIYCLIFFPFFLASSIFVADLICVIINITLFYIFLKKKLFDFFVPIKNYIITFVLLYIIILISLFLTEFKSISFLPSFFYFRYIFLSLSIYYLIKKYDFLKTFFLIIILFNFLLIILDANIQNIFNYNLFGYKKMGIDNNSATIYITSFFNEEKKLGSYIVRLLPLVLSLLYLNKTESEKYQLIILFLSGITVFYSSERTALFLLFVIYFFYFILSKMKTRILFATIFIFISLFNLEKQLSFKYLSFTFEQTGLSSIFESYKNKQPFKEKMVRYYSKEHEDLSFTAYKIFKDNYFFGTGIKSFFHQCNKILKNEIKIENSRNNKLLCSTHPHNTYLQILSEIGIFGFLIIFLFFLKSLLNIFKLILFTKYNALKKSYYFINLSIIINIMPFIPSGSIFNNWISLMIFFPIGFYLYIYEKNHDEDKLNK